MRVRVKDLVFRLGIGLGLELAPYPMDPWIRIGKNDCESKESVKARPEVSD